MTMLGRSSLVGNGGQWEDKNLLQRSQLRQHGVFRHVSVSERQLCGQNVCGPFGRAALATNVEESDRAMVADGTTKASVFCVCVTA